MLENDLAFLEKLRTDIDAYLFLGFVPSGTTPGGQDPASQEMAEALKRSAVQELRRRISEGKPRAKEIMKRYSLNPVFTQRAPPLVGGGLIARQHFLDVVTDNQTWHRIEKKTILDSIDQAIGGMKEELRQQDERPEAGKEAREQTPSSPTPGDMPRVLRRRSWYRSRWFQWFLAPIISGVLVLWLWDVISRKGWAPTSTVEQTTQNTDPELIQLFFSEWQVRFKSGDLVKGPRPITQGEYVELRLAIQDGNLRGPRIRNVYLDFPLDTNVKSGTWAGREWVKSNKLKLNQYFYQFDNTIPKGEAQFLAPISVLFQTSGIKEVGLHITAEGIEAVHRLLRLKVDPPSSSPEPKTSDSTRRP